jgi:hypothetical protein
VARKAADAAPSCGTLRLAIALLVLGNGLNQTVFARWFWY